MAAVLVLASSAEAAPTRVNGIDVVMEPPSGFAQATAFTGFQHVQSFATIEIRELDAPFPTIREQLRADAFTGQEMKLISKDAVTLHGRDGLLIQLESIAKEAAFNKWMLVIGDRYRSLSVTASYPALAEQKLSGRLRESLLSTHWLRTPLQQLFYDLPFTAIETADLKYSKRTLNMLVLADISGTGALSPKSPSIVIGHLNSAEELPDLPTLSHRQLAQLTTVEITEVLDEGEMKVDGIRAYRIHARARLKGDDEPMAFQQIITRQPFKYLLIQSSVEEAAAGRYRDQFEEVVNSITFKQAN